MNTTCNYRCSYCTQRFVDDRGQWATRSAAVPRGVRGAAGDWEIKLSGGEPFRHPDLLGDRAPRSRGANRRVSVVTNFASPLAELLAFCDATRARPGLISASLHLEYAEPDEFLAKVVRGRRVSRGHASSSPASRRARTCRASPSSTRSTPPRASRFNVQPEKQDRDVIDYDDGERAQLVQLGGHNGTGEIEPSFAGQPCWAGARYFIVDHRGDAFRCYPARRHRRERLGNLLDGTFRVRAEAAPCRYDYCNCTVPQQRGMVGRRRRT